MFREQPVLAVTGVNMMWALVAGKRLSHDDKKLQHLVDLLYKAFRSSEVRLEIHVTVQE